MNLFYALLIFLVILLILFIINQKRNESFDNFTNDKCCDDNQISNCMKYGKTGVCNYFTNDKTCLCQNQY